MVIFKLFGVKNTCWLNFSTDRIVVCVKTKKKNTFLFIIVYISIFFFLNLVFIWFFLEWHILLAHFSLKPWNGKKFLCYNYHLFKVLFSFWNQNLFFSWQKKLWWKSKSKSFHKLNLYSLNITILVIFCAFLNVQKIITICITNPIWNKKSHCYHFIVWNIMLIRFNAKISIQ